MPTNGPGIDNAFNANRMQMPSRLTDNLGKAKISQSQSQFDADFEYSGQPMRWETFTAGGGTVVASSGIGGVTMSVGPSAGDIAIRQTRPYIRYQPGKTILMATGMVFGVPVVNQRQRVGFFDDGNGVFFEQADPSVINPSGMYVVWRSDTGGLPTDKRIGFDTWADPYNVKNSVDFRKIQMYFVEYAWYGAGLLRWGVYINGQPWTMHQEGIGNYLTDDGVAQTLPWARTGNLPVRYELRNVGPVNFTGLLLDFAQGNYLNSSGYTRTNYFRGASSPATQTITLPVGSYFTNITGSGSAAVAAGTATITGAGSATASAYLNFSVTVAGTVTVTVAGGPTTVHVGNGHYPSTFINTGSAAVSVTTYASSNPADVGDLVYTRSGPAYAPDSAGNLIGAETNGGGLAITTNGQSYSIASPIMQEGSY